MVHPQVPKRVWWKFTLLGGGDKTCWYPPIKCQSSNAPEGQCIWDKHWLLSVFCERVWACSVSLSPRQHYSPLCRYPPSQTLDIGWSTITAKPIYWRCLWFNLRRLVLSQLSVPSRLILAYLTIFPDLKRCFIFSGHRGGLLGNLVQIHSVLVDR